MKPPPLQWLPVFAYAAKYQNFSKAAQALHVSAPAVSQQIKALEQHLGLTLFSRNGPKLALTEAGRHYQQLVDNTLQHYRRDFEVFERRYHKRNLKLNAPLFIAQELLIPNYMSYRDFVPGGELRITTGSQYIDFTDDDNDLALRFGQGSWPKLDAHLLCKVQAGAVCSPSFYTMHVHGTTALKTLLNEHTLITVNEQLDEWHALFPNLDVKNAIICDSYFSAIKAAEQGLGIALGMYPVINQWLNDGRLKALQTELIDTPSGYWLVYPEHVQGDAQIEACYRWTKHLFQQLPPLLRAHQ